MIIGIAGGASSGKTSIAEHIAAQFKGAVSVIHVDDHRVHGGSTHTHAIDDVDMEALFTEISNAQQKPGVRAIILEGKYVLSSEYVRKLTTLRVFIECDIDEMLCRMIESQHGVPNKVTIKTFREHVKPKHVEVVAPSVKHADLRISNNGDKRVDAMIGPEMIVSSIKEHIGA